MSRRYRQLTNPAGFFDAVGELDVDASVTTERYARNLVDGITHSHEKDRVGRGVEP